MMKSSDLQDYGFEHTFGTWNKRGTTGTFRIDTYPLGSKWGKEIKAYTNSKPYTGIYGGAFDLDKQFTVYKLETALKLARLYGFV